MHWDVVVVVVVLRAGCCCALSAGGTGRESKPKVQIFSLILTCSSLTLGTWQGKWVFYFFFFLSTALLGYKRDALTWKS